jgi:hypothetical protein
MVNTWLVLQIGKHWAINSTPEMTTEKLQYLAASAIDGQEKVKILKLWNSTSGQKTVMRFPHGPFNDSLFNVYLHKYVFWAQIKKAAISTLRAMVGPDLRTSKDPSIKFPAYIESNKIRQWDYAFNVSIAKKEIQKSNEWEKQLHAEPASHRLVYR